MKIDISTVIRQDDFIQGYTKGSMTLESKFGWKCPQCGEYVHDYVMETFSHLNDMRERVTIINRSMELKNDGTDWLCDECKKSK